MSQELIETIDRGSIEKLVRSFYAKVLEDKELAPFFLNALGDDMNNDKWYEHLITLDNFWLGMILEEGRYIGDPLLPHVFLPNLTPELFDQWLKVFRETLEEIYTPSNVRKIHGKAKALSTRFIKDLELDEDDDDY
ncbi:MAG: Preprotein translocase [uncultured Sulfurovum sp.]|uniref:Preprotein translocase n=1 Tax=uncultured Sulfurovum sp. TaxID=269237 RepID=A0A6S6SJH6_9BACT|nr:MAG: Preprotein translocase [uncultured Sulfurovum sp.]